MDVATHRARDGARAILLVHGQIGARIALAEALRAARCQVFEAGNADEALTLLNTRLEIDSIVIQAQVGGSMGGDALADWVRRTRPSLHVVVVSDGIEPGALLGMLPAATPDP